MLIAGFKPVDRDDPSFAHGRAPMKRVFFSVGEPSGDLHGSNLIRHLKSIDPEIDCVGFGGPKMAAVGLDQHYDLTQHAVMMFLTVLKKLRFFFSLVDQAEEYMKTHQVDAVVLIDYPGFNWHIAKRAKRLGIPVFYYGVPQVWAWAPWRVKKIRKFVDHVLCKLPFEKSWFEARGCRATYVGHPFFDQLATQETNQEFLDAFHSQGRKRNAANRDRIHNGSLSIHDRAKVLLLLPGSRNREVRDNLPGMLASARLSQQENPDLRVAIGFFNQLQCDNAKEQVAESKVDCELYVDRTPELMKSADVCIACSGSVSLELMYHHLPTVIVYKISRRLNFCQRLFIRARFITLVNLLGAPKISRDGWSCYNPDAADAEHVPMPEYLFTGDRSVPAAARINHWLNDESARQATARELKSLTDEFGAPGASGRAATYIAQELGLARARRAAA